MQMVSFFMRRMFFCRPVLFMLTDLAIPRVAEMAEGEILFLPVPSVSPCHCSQLNSLCWRVPIFMPAEGALFDEGFRHSPCGGRCDVVDARSSRSRFHPSFGA